MDFDRPSGFFFGTIFLMMELSFLLIDASDFPSILIAHNILFGYL